MGEGYPSQYVKKYMLGILIDPHLNWSYNTELIAPRLNQAIGILSKIRHFVSLENLWNIYFGIFSSLLMYGAQIWCQHYNKHLKRIIKIQDKAIRIINFVEYRESTKKKL